MNLDFDARDGRLIIHASEPADGYWLREVVESIQRADYDVRVDTRGGLRVLFPLVKRPPPPEPQSNATHFV